MSFSSSRRKTGRHNDYPLRTKTMRYSSRIDLFIVFSKSKNKKYLKKKIKNNQELSFVISLKSSMFHKYH